MNHSQPTGQDPINDFVDDDLFHDYRRASDRLDKPIIATHLFASFSLLMFIFFMILHYQTLDWFSVVLGSSVITIYYCLGYYSRYQPFTSFTILIVFELALMVWNFVNSSGPALSSIILPVALIVVLALKLDDAKLVQSYTKANKKNN